MDASSHHSERARHAAVMAGLQTIMEDVTCRCVPISPDTRIDRYILDVCGADSIEYFDLVFRIEARFGIRLNDADWEWMVGGDRSLAVEEWERLHAHQFTFGRLADRIIERARLQPIVPATICGSTCGPAGAFLWLDEVARRIDACIVPFGPSTPILDRFRGRNLSRLWLWVTEFSGGRVPPLQSPHSKSTPALLRSIFSCSIIGMCVGAAALLGWIDLGRQYRRVDDPMVLRIVDGMGALGLLGLIGSTLAAFVCLIAGSSYNRAAVRGIRPPAGIVTFRHLSEALAGSTS